MSDAVAVALITSALALAGTLGVAWVQSFSGSKRLEQQVNALKTLAPLVERNLPSTREAYESVARQIVRKHRVRPWWKRIFYVIVTLAAAMTAIWLATRFGRFLDQANLTPGAKDGSGYALEVSLYVIGVAALAGATVAAASRALFARYEQAPWSGWVERLLTQWKSRRLAQLGE
ncbi:hypothetical protein ACFQRL_01135 [Microbacterium fluvii]|uniref:Uncharacterized protein n=1 Tax=Microbacterium fluvii TaxID=415215 RepID=A0ABW2H8Y7_9MICO|nr:hypothetical protein [Microbacterium fluvii]MCU4671191.1 hypothetical protein [Microbacterium fluvii]